MCFLDGLKDSGASAFFAKGFVAADVRLDETMLFCSTLVEHLQPMFGPGSTLKMHFRDAVHGCNALTIAHVMQHFVELVVAVSHLKCSCNEVLEASSLKKTVADTEWHVVAKQF